MLVLHQLNPTKLIKSNILKKKKGPETKDKKGNDIFYYVVMKFQLLELKGF